MKRITIGRSTDCDIVINDQTDNVSRRHAVITFDLFGRMTISDTSSNGTFINDQRMLKGASLPVTREDKVRLGKAWILDWNTISDPTKGIRRFLFTAAALVFIAIAGVCTFSFINGDKSDNTTSEIKQTEEQTDTLWDKKDTQDNRPSDAGIDPNTGEASAKGGTANSGKSASSSKKKGAGKSAPKGKTKQPAPRAEENNNSEKPEPKPEPKPTPHKENSKNQFFMH